MATMNIVYCGERDPFGFLLARCETASNKSTAVLYTAKKNDENWDIVRGDEGLNVTWLQRTSESAHLQFKLNQPQTITLSSVLPQKAVWDKMNGAHSF